MWERQRSHARNREQSASSRRRPRRVEAGQVAPVIAEQPMIARTATLRLEVKELAAARTGMEAILERHHGYLADLSATAGGSVAQELQVTLRVPSSELDQTLKELKSLGRVQEEKQSGEEVTQQHADLAARLTNAREAEQRLQAILRERAGKMSDVLEVETEITRERGAIEAMEAELKGLEKRVEFASIQLQMAEEYKAALAIAAPLGVQLHNALVSGYERARDLTLGIILFFIEYGPVLLIWAALIGIPCVLVWRRIRNRLAHTV